MQNMHWESFTSYLPITFDLQPRASGARYKLPMIGVVHVQVQDMMKIADRDQQTLGRQEKSDVRDNIGDILNWTPQEEEPRRRTVQRQRVSRSKFDI